MTSHRQASGQTILMLCKYNDFQHVQANDVEKNKPLTRHRQAIDTPNIKNIINKKTKERKEDENAREDIFTAIDIHFENYLKNKKLMAAVMSSQKITENYLKNQLIIFVEKLKTEGKFSKTADDFNTHFISWLKIQVKNQNNSSYGKLTGVNAAFD